MQASLQANTVRTRRCLPNAMPAFENCDFLLSEMYQRQQQASSLPQVQKTLDSSTIVLPCHCCVPIDFKKVGASGEKVKARK